MEYKFNIKDKVRIRFGNHFAEGSTGIIVSRGFILFPFKGNYLFPGRFYTVNLTDMCSPHLDPDGSTRVLAKERDLEKVVSLHD